MSTDRGPGGGGADQGDALSARKAEHLRLALDGDVGFVGLDTGFDRLRVRARALPGRDLDDVDLSVQLWGHRLRAPLLLSCMTGGTTEAGHVNRALAVAAQAHGVAVGLGSGRVLLDDPRRTEGFDVRDVAPDVPVFANLGAAQLAERGVDSCAWLVERCGADALVVHVNAVQEAIQPGGQTAFGGLTERLTALTAELPVPVVVKEVGFGLGPEDVAELVQAGVAAVDIAGAGGTNWARLEGHRDADAAEVAGAFLDWGWPTALAVRSARAMMDELGSRSVYLIASGGVRHGVDALKALCLGADLVGLARGVLPAAAEGPEAATHAVGVVARQLRIGAWAAGAGSVDDLGPTLLMG